jgi:alcohol dehydrogenase
VKTVWDFYLPTRVIFGVGSLCKIKETTDAYKPKRILLVTGKRSVKESGISEQIYSYLQGYDIAVFDGVEGNPKTKTIKDGVEFLKANESDLVIGLGGGSAMDSAKALSVLAQNSGAIQDYLTGKLKITKKGVTLFAVPTVAGTGSEVTPYASITTEEKKKKSLAHPYICPAEAIVDPALTVTTPKDVTATGGMDALSQCIEAYWSKGHTPISDAFALSGAELVFNNLADAFGAPENVNYREKMSLGSLFSGVAIGISRTTIVHAVSYPLTVHFGIPHGLACALTLPSFIRYNAQESNGRIEELARKLGAATPEDLAKKVTALMNTLKLPSKLSAFGVREADIDLIIKEGFRPDRAGNNPRNVSANDLKELLIQIL